MFTSLLCALSLLTTLAPPKASVWTLNLKQHTAEASATTDRVGTGIQIAILFIGLIVTYLVARKQQPPLAPASS